MIDAVTLNIVRALPLALLLAGCQSHGDEPNVPGNRDDNRPYSEIAANETVRFTGTEPFWGGQVAGKTLVYETPETPKGERIAVERFDGRGGLSWSGTLNAAPFTMTLTPGDCSDGMSDRTYPFVATLQIGDALRSGCAWSDAHPFKGDAAP
ncbi:MULTISPECIES: COG3650 family protein [unclassified Sphingobium]|uniref:COG3650 family protein n=1 Tax=unclassified Sphingobium TaxID=2611147 RepID=UPI0022243537|nr:MULTISPECIES: hypothetical protein [unclassified Sphingobium]MCW2395620.1 putative membrane protein [Sphingobium sp. B8D3B]MCW2419135.1 putative membrane protein [Sphingobium sp. B8D3C]